jgi:AAA family ATP:ADP antiporter
MHAFVQPRRAVWTAMFCAAGVFAQFIAGKATRDAIYLATLDVTSLPAMVVATAAVSIGLVVLMSKGLRRISPGTFVSMAFAVNAAMLIGEWLLLSTAPRAAAVLVYLQISGVGPLLGSGFWLIATERFDPHTARRRFGQIAGAGTLGGLLGGLLAERVGAAFGVAATLPLLAMGNLYCAWMIRRLAVSGGADRSGQIGDVAPDLAAETPRSGWRVLHEAAYLQNLALLVLLGTLAAALVDYVFKAQAVVAFGRGEALLSFFAIYYSATSLITFVLQTSTSRLALERLGLGAITGTPSIAVVAGGIGSLVWPGLPGIVAARGAESVGRGGLFRSAYELFYTPIPPAEKRAAKSFIDVGVDRLGDALGGGVIQLVLLVLVPASQYSVIVAIAIACSCVALVVSTRLNRGYVQTLERSLRNRALELDLSELEDLTTKTVMLRTLRERKPDERGRTVVEPSAAPAAAPAAAQPILDPEVADIVVLRSKDRNRISALLRRHDAMPGALVPHVIPLLAWDPVAEDAVLALRKVAEARVGQLVDALVDANQSFAVRRRLARVFSVCTAQRAVDGLVLGLDDQRFEVRFQCGRSLAAIAARNPAVRIEAVTIYAVVLRELAVGRAVWESHRLLDRLDESGDRSAEDELIKDRANQGLAHIFTLLSLVQPAEPLQIAYRGLLTGDENLRGTALEYLEATLPPLVRTRLWPFLEDRRPANRPVRDRDEILGDLIRSHASIRLNLEELRQRIASTKP